MPAAVPHLDPRVVAAQVGPQRRADDARRDAHRAAGIHQQNGQPAARGEAALHAFERALVGLFALRGVADFHGAEKRAVQRLRGLAGCLAVRHERRGDLPQLPPPLVASLIEAGVGQHVIEENVRRNPRRPRRGGAGLVSQRGVSEQEAGGQAAQILRRHVGDEESHPLALRFRGGGKGFRQLRAIFAGLGERAFHGARGGLGERERGAGGEEEEWKAHAERCSRVHGKRQGEPRRRSNSG